MGLRKRIFTLSGAIAAGLVAITIGLVLWSTALSPASQGQVVDAKQNLPPSLEESANQADELSDQVYSGLDTTKKIIGKTEARNEAIETGRDAASQKLDELGDRARQAKETGKDVLTKTDKRILNHISE